ncbi:NYN domain-containing protein [Aliivibrio fischeri]|uniref:NYN domain-containing protein n=2 Tax=Aliivibrio fischeri TaxID=668 RepID=UPI00076A3015|nr:NYN domain-containing protein [Aliivibrio fischeri]MBP3141604.1 NYN domain-containing protein [Aliivibrio fischeri]MBP3157777.1 NYN domain-containing protein [Aliivibrio fischeri]MCE7572592.1 NYN domain-containing protein [Aliivibrio fischeri]USR97102.1 NYN domain-containing protein [Aliivibrio fischeri ATCC 7744 = JCM 18803 = DSM 507]USR97147.1 NYN domain-containing protein [Aliivibrio fischeri ATCC 7744 = JCM 18803 = DSM 507]
MKDKEKIALFIDADNAPAAKIDSILSELAKFGVVNIRKAYGNWKNCTLKSWEDVLHEYAIQPIQQFDLVKGKNATDIALVIDAMDVLYTKDVDIICIVSSDCDFTPLVTRALADGKFIIGFGERKAPSAFVNSCSKFLYLDQEDVENKPVQKKTQSIKSDTKLMNLLRQAIGAVDEDDGWTMLGQIGTHISNHASFDPRNYGFKKLSDLFLAIDLFEMKKTHGSVYWVREKKKAKNNKAK